MARTLARFTITEDGEDYLLHIEDDSGETIEVAATFDQLDLIAEALMEHLDEDDDDFEEVEDDEEEADKAPAR